MKQISKKKKAISNVCLMSSTATLCAVSGLYFDHNSEGEVRTCRRIRFGSIQNLIMQAMRRRRQQDRKESKLIDDTDNVCKCFHVCLKNLKNFENVLENFTFTWDKDMAPSTSSFAKRKSPVLRIVKGEKIEAPVFQVSKVEPMQTASVERIHICISGGLCFSRNIMLARKLNSPYYDRQLKENAIILKGFQDDILDIRSFNVGSLPRRNRQTLQHRLRLNHTFCKHSSAVSAMVCAI
uniref:Uncharacterized protein n=1 Tax=Glossina palpalis gambiensis TaxID=67801 RepID=A0A1B0BY97_9MUSC